MKLLILTQKVDKNDPILGFFHRWIEEFAKHCESLVVICLEIGEYNLPDNTRILSLGKEGRRSRFQYVWRFYKYIWKERKNYDAVFVHMNQEYVVLGGIIWKFYGKKISMWYVHKQTNLKLWIAEKFSYVIYTSAPESFQLKSKKVKYVGHGIDIGKFPYSKWNSGSRTLVHVGRITPIKNCQVLIEALDILRQSDLNWKVTFIGEAITPQDFEYKEELKELIEKKGLDGSVDFVGPLSQMEISSIYARSFASINMTPTGGMDKVVLESWASGCPAFTSNSAFKNLLGSNSSEFIFSDIFDLVSKVERFGKVPGSTHVVSSVSHKVQAEYNVSFLISKLADELSQIK